MDSSYARLYADLATRHWWWRARRKVVLSQIARLAKDGHVHRILDIGCGDGSLLEYLLPFGDASGIEPDPDVIAPSNPHRDRIRIAPFGPDFEDDETYDLILMLDVLEHIADDSGAARRLKELMTPGGHAIITVPALPQLWSMHDVVNQHFRRYTMSSLNSTLTAAGFHILSIRYLFGWTVGALVLRRFLARPTNSNNEKRAYQVSVPPRPINEILYGLCRFEEQSIGRIGLPFGSSLLATVSRS